METTHSLAESDFDRRLTRWIMSRAGNPRIWMRLWNGEEFPVTDAHPVACMELKDRKLYRVGEAPGMESGR